MGRWSAAPSRCKEAVYGVNFDFDKATLRADAAAALGQMLGLLQEEKELAVEIGGHSDNIGKSACNARHSQSCADAVKAWLVQRGVAASRLTTRGYGDGVPVVPNSSDENRARNRRVELKKPGC